MQQNQSQNPMAVEPVPKLMARIGLPIVLSMILQAAYNVVDSAYLARMAAGGETALTALSLAFPVQLFMVAVSIGTGVGTNALLARLLGLGDKDRADAAVGNAQFLALVISAVFMLFSAVGVVPYVNSQSAGGSISGEVLSEAIDYLHICCGIPFGIVFFSVYEKTLQATGRSLWSTVAQISGALVNIMLDPFLIYGWCGLPAMGTTGAAIATVIGQAFGALAGFLFHHKHNKEVNIRLSDCRPDGHIILDIYRIGFPSILMVGIGSLTNYLMNRILMAFTSTAVALYGAYFKLQSFFFMPVFGLNNGIVPIVGYNYGARKKERIYRTIRYGVLYAVCILAVGLLLFEAIPGVLLQAFSPSEHMLAIGIPALRKIAIHFPIAAFCIVGGSVCQALGKSLYSFFTSVLRQVVALIPAAYLLSLTGNVGNVWWCFPIAEVVSACATAFFLRRALRNMDRELTLAEGQ